MQCLRLGKELGIPFLMNLQDIAYGYKGDSALAEEALSAVQYLWQSVLDSLSGAKKGDKPKAELMKENKPIIDALLSTMTMSLNSRTVSGEARDVILQILTKNVGKRKVSVFLFLNIHLICLSVHPDYTNLNWAEKFVEVKGLQKLSDVGAEVPELRVESAIPVTPNTRGLLAVLMLRIYNNMYYDKARERYTTEVDEFLK